MIWVDAPVFWASTYEPKYHCQHTICMTTTGSLSSTSLQYVKELLASTQQTSRRPNQEWNTMAIYVPTEASLERQGYEQRFMRVFRIHVRWKLRIAERVG